MKKQTALFTAIIIIIYFILTALPEFMPAAAQKNDSEVKYQTWEEFLKSGVQIEYDETPAITDHVHNPKH